MLAVLTSATTLERRHHHLDGGIASKLGKGLFALFVRDSSIILETCQSCSRGRKTKKPHMT